MIKPITWGIAIFDAQIVGTLGSGLPDQALSQFDRYI
jgi:hypothetical protein